MATSGSRDKNPFRPGGNLGQNEYYLLVDRDGPNKGRITIKQKTPSGNITGTSGDRTVGFIPLDNSFQPAVGVGGLGAGGPTPSELRYFSSAAGQRTVKDKGIETVVNSGVSQQEATQLIRPNSALPGGTGTPVVPATVDGGAADITPEALQNVTIETPQGSESDFGSSDNLRYPIDLQVSEQDYIQFSQITNEGRSIGGNLDNVFGGLGNRVQGTTINGTVTLPIQSGITDSNGVDWGGAKLDAKDSYLASLALGGITSNKGLGEAAGGLLGRVFGDLKDAANKAKDPNFTNAFNLYLAQEAVGVQGLLSRAGAAILNPNLELLFNGPTLRSFSFTFRLSPRSKKEAENVRRIIRFFKEGMSVKTASSGVFLKSPNIFNIKYIAAGANKHKSLPLIKQCALLGCDVDYTPDGTYMTFNDEAKTMTSYQLTLRFSELDPIYNTDYKKDAPGLDEIGY